MPSLFTRDAAGAHLVASRLRTQVLLLGAIALVIIGFIIRDVVLGDLPAWLAALAVVVGIAIGYAVGRLMTIRRHEETSQIVSQMDIVGGIAIALYIALDLSRTWLLGHFLAGPALSAASLSILAGALLGRGFGIRHSIGRLLRNPSV